MRFLLDQNLSPKVAPQLRAAGHDVTIAREVGLQAALVLDNLDVVAADLEAGAIVVLGESTLRIHRLPIGQDND